MRDHLFDHGQWAVWREVEQDDDVRKADYTARHKITGDERRIDVSPYLGPDNVLIRAIIDLDFPTRHDAKAAGPLTASNVLALQQSRHASDMMMATARLSAAHGRLLGMIDVALERVRSGDAKEAQRILEEAARSKIPTGGRHYAVA